MHSYAMRWQTNKLDNNKRINNFPTYVFFWNRILHQRFHRSLSKVLYMASEGLTIVFFAVIYSSLPCFPMEAPLNAVCARLLPHIYGSNPTMREFLHICRGVPSKPPDSSSKKDAILAHIIDPCFERHVDISQRICAWDACIGHVSALLDGKPSIRGMRLPTRGD